MNTIQKALVSGVTKGVVQGKDARRDQYQKKKKKDGAGVEKTSGNIFVRKGVVPNKFTSNLDVVVKLGEKNGLLNFLDEAITMMGSKSFHDTWEEKYKKEKKKYSLSKFISMAASILFFSNQLKQVGVVANLLSLNDKYKILLEDDKKLQLKIFDGIKKINFSSSDEIVSDHFERLQEGFGVSVLKKVLSSVFGKETQEFTNTQKENILKLFEILYFQVFKRHMILYRDIYKMFGYKIMTQPQKKKLYEWADLLQPQEIK